MVDLHQFALLPCVGEQGLKLLTAVRLARPCLNPLDGTFLRAMLRTQLASHVTQGAQLQKKAMLI